VLISGEVQGVFFRQETKRKADSLNVKGWVRNRHDGTVEAVFEGEETGVKAMIDFCKKGPPGAVVVNVEVAWENFMAEYSDFYVRFS
jgi:acylphosphatase